MHQRKQPSDLAGRKALTREPVEVVAGQIDYALDHGVNLIDTAEMYPVPPRAETQGSTERFIGTWLAQHRSAREKIVLATKIAGPARQPHNPRHIRGETNQFDRKNLTEA